MTAPHESRPPTLKDVAAAAGVHPGTASRALTGRRRVDPLIVERVKAAASELGYRVDPIARALRDSRSGMIGMVVPTLQNPFFPLLVSALEESLAAAELTLLLCDAQDSVEREAQRLQALIDRRVDGVIMSPVDRRRSLNAIESAPAALRLVLIDRVVDHDGPLAVVADQQQMMGLVLDHVARRGASRIAFVCPPARSSVYADRLAAFTQLAPTGARCIEADGEGFDAGRASAAALLRGESAPHAVVCANDLLAAGALAAAREAGLACPDDLLVTGFDDTPIGEFLTPPLTSVAQPVREMAASAARLLTEEHTGGTLRLAHPGRLIVRESA